MMRYLSRKHILRPTCWQLALVLCLLAPLTAKAQLLSGFDLQNKEYSGPTAQIIQTDPIWVADYHTLVLNYRAMGSIRADFTVVTLRPGSVGPITPGGNNPENPLASGEDVAGVRGSDLVTDGQPHTLQLELKGKMKTPQIDALEFALPSGAKLSVAELEFRGDEALLPCAEMKPAEIPAGSRTLSVGSGLKCGTGTATTLRGEQALTVAAKGAKGATLYLDLYAHLAGFKNFDASKPQRPKETGDPRYVIANIRYADRPAEVVQEFPLLVAEHRHVIANRERGLYALELDRKRQLLSVEIKDRSPHLQLVLFGAATSDHEEASVDEPSVPNAETKMSATCTAENTLGRSEWFKVSDNAIKADLKKTATAKGLALGLTLTNSGDKDADVTVAFPSLEVHVAADAKDVEYLFPKMVADISSADGEMTAQYGPNFLLQYIDVFAEHAGCGAATIVEDTTGLSKKFALKKDAATVSEQTEYLVHIAAGQSYSLPPVSVVLHEGDWRPGFNAYRQWLASWYKAETPRPAWLDRSFYMRRDYPLGGSGELFDKAQNRYTYDKLIDESKPMGGADFIDISGWALSDKHGRVGDYPIELSTPADLKANIAKGWKEGVPTGLYFEGYLVDKNSDIGKAHGAEWQIIDKDGKGMWWPSNPEMFLCPRVGAWQDFISHRVASVAKEVGAQAVYLDEYGCSDRLCYATNHGHAVGANMIGGQIETAKKLRAALDAEGLKETIFYTECAPTDVGAPYVDGTFTYAFPASTPSAYNTKLNLWRFAFPQVKLWDMLSSGVEPHLLSAEDFKFSFWHGNGIWLKGRTATWYGEDVLEFLRWAHPLLEAHAAAFAGEVDPLVASGDSHILINRFRGGGETVYTLFNNTYETRRFTFHGKQLTFEPRGVQLVAEKQ
jgi:hypothetical protein